MATHPASAGFRRFFTFSMDCIVLLLAGCCSQGAESAARAEGGGSPRPEARAVHLTYHSTAETSYEDIEIRDTSLTYRTLRDDFKPRPGPGSGPEWTPADIVTKKATLTQDDLKAL